MIDYNQDHTCVIAIRNPEQGIEQTIASELSQLGTPSPNAIRASNDLALVAYRERVPPDLAGLHDIMASHDADYIFMTGEPIGDSPLDQTLMTTAALLAMNVVSYHEERAKEGELPKLKTDYRMDIAVSETPRRGQETEDSETYSVSFEMPLSHIIVIRELERMKKMHGTMTGVYSRSPCSYGGISEQAARTLIKHMKEYYEERSSS